MAVAFHTRSEAICERVFHISFQVPLSLGFSGTVGTGGAGGLAGGAVELLVGLEVATTPVDNALGGAISNPLPP